MTLFLGTFKRKSGKQYYAITCPDGTILEKEENGEPISWLRSEQRFLSDLAIGEARIVKINGKWTVHFKQRQPAGYKPRSLITEYGTTSDGASDLKTLFNITNIFSNPKPTSLLDFLIKFKANRNIIILDFFAGSGTTGHAVMELNKQDGGNRKFILCTNNENGICRDVTYERIKTVITGKRKDGTTYGDPLSASLKYQKIEFIQTSEKAYYDYADELLLHIKELVELENAINFDGNPHLAILLTEDEVETFFADSNTPNCVKTIYLGHDIALTLSQQQQLADNNIGLKIIPEYYYKEQQA